MSDPDPGAAVLARLDAAGDRFLSGAALGGALGITRAAVWKRIEHLRGLGYDIEARPRLGYRLRGTPDILIAARVAPGLDTARVGRRLEHHVEVNSTMAAAAALADAGAEDGTVVVAERQAAGRGRLGRPWHSAPGLGIWMTLLLRPPLTPMELGPLSLMAAVAVADGIAEATGLRPGIKWPNDLLYDGRKLCGMLTELVAEQDAVRFVLLGIGINVHHGRGDFPPELRPQATSLRLALGRPVDRVAAFRSVLRALDSTYAGVLDEGFGPVLDRWRAESVTLGRRVSVAGVGRSLAGVAEDIASNGGLIIRLDSGARETVLSGDVTLHAAADAQCW